MVELRNSLGYLTHISLFLNVKLYKRSSDFCCFMFLAQKKNNKWIGFKKDKAFKWSVYVLPAAPPSIGGLMTNMA